MVNMDKREDREREERERDTHTQTREKIVTTNREGKKKNNICTDEVMTFLAV